MRAADRDDPEARGRFAAEAHCARFLDCQYTPAVIADGSEAAYPFLVSEYVAGPSLAAAVHAAGPLSRPQTVAMALGVADALAQIHRAGIVHRDVKPSNVLLSGAGPRIIDFGIASLDGNRASLTRTGMVMGSPGWMAPERLSGGRATPASDVFCWGMVVAYAATGRHPFGAGGDPAHLAERILSLTPDLRGVPGALGGVVEAALAKDPGHRPAAEDLRRALLAPRHEETAPLAIAELWVPPPFDEPEPATREDGPGRRRPHRALWPVAGFVAGAVVTASAMATVLRPGPSGAPEPRVVVSTVPAPAVSTAPSPTPEAPRRTVPG